jgi:hypothetical protein
VSKFIATLADQQDAAEVRGVVITKEAVALARLLCHCRVLSRGPSASTLKSPNFCAALLAPTRLGVVESSVLVRRSEKS